MKRTFIICAALVLLCALVACGNAAEVKESGPIQTDRPGAAKNEMEGMTVIRETTVGEVIANPALGEFGRLLFPVDRAVSEDMTLAEVSSSDVYVWYSHIQPDKTVEIVNDVISRAERGEQVFYPIYTEAEMDAAPSKRDTGLFFFRGEPGKKFAVVNAGGGFMYVGAMHDSFPHALELSRMGYNAFALIYRPDDPYTDLAQAIAYIYDHADELQVDPEGYSLWGGSAGARMAAELGNGDAMAAFGRPDIPQAAAVVMQYTGYTTVSQRDAPTYACVGTSDGIANWRTMRDRLDRLEALGIPTEFHTYEGLGHGFGLGAGTVAEGWIEDAVKFWAGRTGGGSFGVGCEYVWTADEQTIRDLVRTAVDAGVNYFDLFVGTPSTREYYGKALEGLRGQGVPGWPPGLCRPKRAVRQDSGQGVVQGLFGVVLRKAEHELHRRVIPPQL